MLPAEYSLTIEIFKQWHEWMHVTYLKEAIILNLRVSFNKLYNLD